MPIPGETYDETTRALVDVLDERDRARRTGWGRESRGGGGWGKWPSWLQTVLQIAALIVTVTWAYAQLDKRIALLELKLDYLVVQSGLRVR